MKRLVTRDLYAVAAAFLAPHYVNGSAGIWRKAFQDWKATVVALKTLQQLKLVLLRSL